MIYLIIILAIAVVLLFTLYMEYLQTVEKLYDLERLLAKAQRRIYNLTSTDV